MPSRAISRAGLAVDVRDERVDESLLDRQPGAPGRQLDRAAQLVASHRAHEDVVGGQQAGKLRVRGTAAVEVRLQREEHKRPAAFTARSGH